MADSRYGQETCCKIDGVETLTIKRYQVYMMSRSTLNVPYFLLFESSDVLEIIHPFSDDSAYQYHLLERLAPTLRDTHSLGTEISIAVYLKFLMLTMKKLKKVKCSIIKNVIPCYKNLVK